MRKRDVQLEGMLLGIFRKDKTITSEEFAALNLKLTAEISKFLTETNDAPLMYCVLDSIEDLILESRQIIVDRFEDNLMAAKRATAPSEVHQKIPAEELN